MNIETMLAEALKKITSCRTAEMSAWYEGMACGMATAYYRLDLMTDEAFSAFCKLAVDHGTAFRRELLQERLNVLTVV